jgi:8-oxo-dGTP pyrophosphatase MutT (NUDIX family)
MTLRERVGKQLILLPSVAAVVHDDEGRLLLQERASGEGWSLPAGGIEPGETPRSAIARELMEETGIAIASARIIDVYGGKDFRYTYPNGDQVEYVVTLFKCEVGSVGKWTDAETKSLRYFARSDMPPLALPYPHSDLFK